MASRYPRRFTVQEAVELVCQEGSDIDLPGDSDSEDSIADSGDGIQ